MCSLKEEGNFQRRYLSLKQETAAEHKRGEGSQAAQSSLHKLLAAFSAFTLASQC